MAFVERGELRGPALERMLRREVLPALTPPPDAVVLGCTHFPFLQDAIRAVAGTELRFFDGAEGTARETRRRLTEAGLLLPEDRKGRVTLENSSDDRRLIDLELWLLDS